MGRSSKIKGAKYERVITKKLNDAGIPARKVPMSGALEGFPGDIVLGAELGTAADAAIDWGDIDITQTMRCEVKARKGGKGFAVTKGWLGENDILFLQEIVHSGGGRRNPEPLVMMSWEAFQKVATAFIEKRAVELAQWHPKPGDRFWIDYDNGEESGPHSVDTSYLQDDPSITDPVLMIIYLDGGDELEVFASNCRRVAR